ncbi:MAG: ATP-dependent helicase UvrD/PcrA [Thermoanaerobaculia bacterium]|jgi:DNA helicase-2/ATP-dependent DNA helicase PcrA|nr:ATP-dependent helicase UvrD/PcrA [Thermoanaerobaculia bacterium]
MIDLAGLNPQQRDAVTHGEGPLLVLAGAGSGKTRVITYRIAWLIGELGVHPTNILAVTFTNKAANEMISRVGLLAPNSGARAHGNLWIGTFHSTSLRMLRRHAERLGYTKSFVVYDTSDQLTLIRRCMRELQMNDEAFPPRSILTRISNAKNELIGPAEYEKDTLDFFGSRVAEVYRLYQKRLKEFDAMDFDDLIGNYVQLIEKNADIADEIHNRFQHLLIDEYQDTNRAQYMLIKALAGKRQNIVAVGDEDQSIYKFRGADINNILNFERDFPGARIIKLEQNYRSTGNILDAATGVVSNNIARKGKTLFTDSGSGEPVRVVTCGNEREEAQFVIEKITGARGKYKLSDYAILFRTNAQSRPFEEELLRANIPYSVVGGVKFYERAEIKDVLCFLRLTIRPHDTPSIERVINVPSRGIGDTTTKALNDHAAAQNVTLWTIIEGDLSFLPPRASKAVREFRDIVHDLNRVANNPLPELYDYLLLRTGYRRMLQESRDVQDESRLQNIDEMMNSAREYSEQNPGASLADYLDSLTLMSDLDKYESQKGVTLMTLHSAKGLEYKVVFLTGMEEGILPHSQSKDSNDDLEEERRLCYVGMTRAREQLWCVHCLERRLHGQFREQNPSPFITEIPENVREEVRLARARYVPEAQSWRERPMGAYDRYGDRYGGENRRPQSYGRPSAPARPVSPPRAIPSAPPPQPRKNDSVNGVLSFFKESPVQLDPAALRPATPQNVPKADLKRGQRVRHEQFGDGTILTMEGSGPEAKLTVYFDRIGSKKFIAKYAKLMRI